MGVKLHAETRTDRRVELHDVVRPKEDSWVAARYINESDGTGDGHESNRAMLRVSAGRDHVSRIKRETYATTGNLSLNLFINHDPVRSTPPCMKLTGIWNKIV